MTTNRPLRVFLCHSSNDKPAVRELYQKLRAEPWIQPWLDEEELYPGQDWNMEIEKAVEAADAIIVCLTKNSINKDGYVQRELRIVLEFADYKPEGTLYIIPVRLEDCELPRSLRKWQYADYFEGQRERGLQRLLVSLQKRANSLGFTLKESAPKKEEASVEKEKPELEPVVKIEKIKPSSLEKNPIVEVSKLDSFNHPTLKWIATNKITLSNGMELMRIPAGKFLMGSDDSKYDDEKPQHVVNIPYDYWMARFPVTNELYTVFVRANELRHPVSDWGKKKDHPVVQIKWIDAMNYCIWLNEILISELPLNLILRLPTEAEWEKAARGVDGRKYPWGNEFDVSKCNSYSGGVAASIFNIFISGTSYVKKYSPQGDSPYGCSDMIGNVWERTHSIKRNYPYILTDGREGNKTGSRRVMRGGSYYDGDITSYCSSREKELEPDFTRWDIGFRICLAPPLPK